MSSWDGTMSIFRGDAEFNWQPQTALGSAKAYLIFSPSRQVLVGPTGPVLTDWDIEISQGATTLVGHVGEHDLYVGQWTKNVPAGYEWCDLRATIRSSADDHEFIALSAGIQRLEFLLDHRFCGRCGHATELNPGDSGIRCGDTECRAIHYPRIAPSVIVLVTRGDQCLLARSPRFEPGMYSTLAGFIEAGESAEHAIRREIREEVGIEVKNPTYFGTQSWPFKHSLMMGYFAEYAAGHIEVDGVEIVDANWYRRDTLPQLPLRASISRALIDTWLASGNH